HAAVLQAAGGDRAKGPRGNGPDRGDQFRADYRAVRALAVHFTKGNSRWRAASSSGAPYSQGSKASAYWTFEPRSLPYSFTSKSRSLWARPLSRALVCSASQARRADFSLGTFQPWL